VPVSLALFQETVWYVNKAAKGLVIVDTAAYTAKPTIPAAIMNSKKYTTYEVSKVFIQSFHTVRPIPQSQIGAVTNKDEFKQNQAYQ
jgi:hypothetical protein